MYAAALNLRRTFSLFRNTGPALPSMSPLSGSVNAIVSTISQATGKRISSFRPFVLQQQLLSPSTVDLSVSPSPAYGEV